MDQGFTLLPILAITWDLTINVGHILSGLALGLAAFVGKKIYEALSGFVDGVSVTQEIVDEHSDVIVKAGWANGKDWPRVSERRSRIRRSEERV